MGRLPAALVLVLLPLAGCAGAPGPGASLDPAPAVVSTAARPGPRASEPTPAPVAVPTVRATLPPPARERPVPGGFRAPAVDIDLPVVPVGVDAAGEMELPRTVREVAWYSYGARPGDPAGTTVLAAHVDTRADGLGPFARLRQLDEGDDLVVTDRDGRERRYRVTDVAEVPKAEVPLDRVFRRDGPATLVVITCGGSFERRTGYRDNVVVTARPR